MYSHRRGVRAPHAIGLRMGKLEVLAVICVLQPPAFGVQTVDASCSVSLWLFVLLLVCCTLEAPGFLIAVWMVAKSLAPSRLPRAARQAVVVLHLDGCWLIESCCILQPVNLLINFGQPQFQYVVISLEMTDISVSQFFETHHQKQPGTVPDITRTRCVEYHARKKNARRINQIDQVFN